jgi:hypothetical protein
MACMVAGFLLRAKLAPYVAPLAARVAALKQRMPGRRQKSA